MIKHLPPVYLDDFKGEADLLEEFKIQKLPDDATIIVARYGYEGYSGSAFVLYEQGGKYFEVLGSHCSCFGLEGQFDPQETSIETCLRYCKTDSKFSGITVEVMWAILVHSQHQRYGDDYDDYDDYDYDYDDYDYDDYDYDDYDYDLVK